MNKNNWIKIYGQFGDSNGAHWVNMKFSGTNCFHAFDIDESKHLVQSGTCSVCGEQMSKKDLQEWCDERNKPGELYHVN